MLALFPTRRDAYLLFAAALLLQIIVWRARIDVKSAQLLRQRGPLVPTHPAAEGVGKRAEDHNGTPALDYVRLGKRQRERERERERRGGRERAVEVRRQRRALAEQTRWQVIIGGDGVGIVGGDGKDEEDELEAAKRKKHKHRTSSSHSSTSTSTSSSRSSTTTTTTSSSSSSSSSPSHSPDATPTPTSQPQPGSGHNNNGNPDSDQDLCEPLPLSLPPAEICAHVKRYCPPSGHVDYLRFYFCLGASHYASPPSHPDPSPDPPSTPTTTYPGLPLYRGAALALIVLWMLFLFSWVGIVASDFFCPNLGTIAARLGLNESTAGVTFLAFGNGSPDVFSTFGAMRSGSGSLAIGELIGAASFIVSVISGSMMLIAPFHVKAYPFCRDVGFFTVAVASTLAFLIDGRLRFVECCALIGIYVAYAGTVIVGSWWQERSRRRRAMMATVRDEYGPALVEQPYRDEPLTPPRTSAARPISPDIEAPAHHLHLLPPSTPLAAPLSPSEYDPSASASLNDPLDLFASSDARSFVGGPSTGPSPSGSPHLSPQMTRPGPGNPRFRSRGMARHSLLGAIEFRDVVASLRQEAFAERSLEVFSAREPQLERFFPNTNQGHQHHPHHHHHHHHHQHAQDGSGQHAHRAGRHHQRVVSMHAEPMSAARTKTQMGDLFLAGAGRSRSHSSASSSNAGQLVGPGAAGNGTGGLKPPIFRSRSTSAQGLLPTRSFVDYEYDRAGANMTPSATLDGRTRLAEAVDDPWKEGEGESGFGGESDAGVGGVGRDGEAQTRGRERGMSKTESLRQSLPKLDIPHLSLDDGCRDGAVERDRLHSSAAISGTGIGAGMGMLRTGAGQRDSAASLGSVGSVGSLGSNVNAWARDSSLSPSPSPSRVPSIKVVPDDDDDARAVEHEHEHRREDEDGEGDTTPMQSDATIFGGANTNVDGEEEEAPSVGDLLLKPRSSADTQVRGKKRGRRSNSSPHANANAKIRARPSSPLLTRTRHLLRTCTPTLRALFPTLQHFHSKSWLGIAVSLLTAPAILALNVTLPVVDDEADGRAAAANASVAAGAAGVGAGTGVGTGEAGEGAIRLGGPERELNASAGDPDCEVCVGVGQRAEGGAGEERIIQLGSTGPSAKEIKATDGDAERDSEDETELKREPNRQRDRNVSSLLRHLPESSSGPLSSTPASTPSLSPAASPSSKDARARARTRTRTRTRARTRTRTKTGDGTLPRGGLGAVPEESLSSQPGGRSSSCDSDGSSCDSSGGSCDSDEEDEEDGCCEKLGREAASAEAGAYDRGLTIAQCVLGPVFCVWAVFSSSPGLSWKLFLSLFSGLLLACFVLLYQSRGPHGPRAIAAAGMARCCLGFIVSIMWIMTIVDEVVGILQTVGLIVGLSDAILGLTIFAMGNSLGDFVANVTIARAGYPIMAISACFAGPMLNLLLGVGISGSYILGGGGAYGTIGGDAIEGAGGIYEIEMSPSLICSGVGLLCVLLGTLVAVPMNGFYLSRRLGMTLISAYALIMATNVLVEIFW